MGGAIPSPTLHAFLVRTVTSFHSPLLLKQPQISKIKEHPAFFSYDIRPLFWKTFEETALFTANKSQRTNTIPSVQALRQAGQKLPRFFIKCFTHTHKKKKPASETVQNTVVSSATRLPSGTASNVGKP